MSSSRTSLHRVVIDHFEPEESLDPKAQRQLRGQLEQIDYAAYAANKKIIGGAINTIDSVRFERLAQATAQARALWVATALSRTESGQPLTAAQTDELTRLRAAFHELSEVYDGLRRMVERGYLTFRQI